MASGEMSPASNTLAPSRVTSRSSASVLSRWETTLAILRRHELEPTSIAAKVGIAGVFCSAKSSLAKIHDETYGQRLQLARCGADRGTPSAQGRLRRRG